LMNLAADDPESQRRMTGFVQALQALGWTDGRNVKIDYRWGAGDVELYRRYAAELLALMPDVILVSGTPVMEVLRGLTRTLPIACVQVVDLAGYVESLAHPGGNATGFTSLDYGFSAKWLELLKETAPSVKRVGVLRDPATGGIGQLAAL